MLGIDQRQTGAEALLVLTGHVTTDSSPEFRTRLLALLREEHPHQLTVDLEGVSYIDTSGLVTLIEALKIARHRGTTLTVKGLHGPIVHLLQVTGLLRLFEANGETNALSSSGSR